ncbi:hypothetical protein PIB30_093279 [Stylosanthes scabra]|uniref:Uncharacterized protein n=1 Tax=Stylosanthes scabra TaxID=79078 RepID=A0ABU6SVP2_9FABA|nr:hypothetical protein [Stylosanthes scabra]
MKNRLMNIIGGTTKNASVTGGIRLRSPYSPNTLNPKIKHNTPISLTAPAVHPVADRGRHRRRDPHLRLCPRRCYLLLYVVSRLTSCSREEHRRAFGSSLRNVSIFPWLTTSRGEEYCWFSSSLPCRRSTGCRRRRSFIFATHLQRPKIKGTVFVVDASGAYVVDVTAKSTAYLLLQKACIHRIKHVQEAGIVPGLREEFVVIGENEVDGGLILSLKAIEFDLAWEHCRQLQTEDAVVKGKVGEVKPRNSISVNI